MSISTDDQKPTQTPLTSFELNMLSWIEQIWYQTGTLPSLDAITEEFNLTRRKLSNHTRKNAWKQAWAARGLPQRDSHSLDQATLSAKQLMVANIILNEHDRSSLKRKLEMAGLTTNQFQAWMADPTFTNYLKKETDRRFKSADIFAHQSLAKLVIDGDLNAIKYYFDITNRHTTQADALNFNSILARLMEILSRYLTPPVLQQVADDLEELMNPSIPRAIEPPRPSLHLVEAMEIPEPFEEFNPSQDIDLSPKGPVGSVNQSREEIAKKAFSLSFVNRMKGHK